MQREDRWVSSQPDYVLTRKGDRGLFRNVSIKRPRHHDSDHRAVVATIYAGSSRQIRGYRKRRGRFPVRLQRVGPRTATESKFEDLKAACEEPPPRQRAANNWILAETWRLVDERAMLRAKGTLSQQKHRQLNRKVKAGLNLDRSQRATDTAEAMELELREGDSKEAWRLLKGWYQNVEDRAPKPCYHSIERQTRERVELYTKVQPPGDPIPINIDPFAINDEVPTDAEVREVVRGLRNGRAGGVSGIRAKHMKQWLRDVVTEEEKGTVG